MERDSHALGVWASMKTKASTSTPRASRGATAETTPTLFENTVSVRTAPAFDALPASPHVHKRPMITAVPPFPDVPGAGKTFSEDGTHAVFEVEGRYY